MKKFSTQLSEVWVNKVLSRKGQGPLAMVIGVVAFIAVAISIAIGYIVLVTTVNTAGSAATGLTSTQSVNLVNLSSSVTGSFLLLTVLPVVLAAGLIIGALLETGVLLVAMALLGFQDSIHAFRVWGGRWGVNLSSFYPVLP